MTRSFDPASPGARRLITTARLMVDSTKPTTPVRMTTTILDAHAGRRLEAGERIVLPRASAAGYVADGFAEYD